MDPDLSNGKRRCGENGMYRGLEHPIASVHWLEAGESLIQTNTWTKIAGSTI